MKTNHRALAIVQDYQYRTTVIKHTKLIV